MLRTNLASRPFYNQRAVRIGLAALVVLAAALSAFNAAQVLSLTSRNRELSGRAEASEARAAELRQQAQAIRAALNRAEVGAVQAAAKEANELIDRRAFSWTDLFNRFEETLPAEVRIVAVRPQVDSDGRMLVVVTVVSRSVENRRDFEDQLEATDAFSFVLTRDENARDDRTLQSVIQAYYEPPAGVAAVPARPESESSGDGAANKTPDKPQMTADEPQIDADTKKPQIDADTKKPQIDADTKKPQSGAGDEQPGDVEKRKPQSGADTKKPQSDPGKKPQIDADKKKPPSDAEEDQPPMIDRVEGRR